MKLKHSIYGGAAALAFAISGVAEAYTLITCNGNNIRWNGNSATMRASNVGFPSGSSWRSALGSSISLVNQNPSAFDYGIVYGDTSVGFNNGQNEIWWTSGFGAPAIANWWMNCNTGRFTEVDIRFDNTVAYTTSTSKSSLWPYGGSYRPFHTTAIHELGHGVGLSHTATTYSIMGQDWDHIHANGSTARAYFGEDASSGAVALYGLNPGTVEDLGVAQWRHTGSSGEYSTHARTRVLTSAGGGVSYSTINGEPRYNVTKGQTYRLEFSFENNGESYQSTKVGYYVSTNDYISTVDTPLKTISMGLGRNTVYTYQTTITIPSTLNSGQNYWLGTIIDKDSTLSEVTETNNRTYLAIRVN
ncbi:matrixin family metalloprotease [Ketobacter alkanivorans]|uniref:matrixin family metalloprotease n=1 Tax=Ketobacter alkanivorans TaxID=1917421 RepID=UPI001F3862DF|nr:matrixin family metalloprotease [Ketobacter alkanivorans]